MRAYVINLDTERDRWIDSISQEEKLGIKIYRVSAINNQTFSHKVTKYLDNTIAAICESHLKAVRLFLKSDEDFCMILEDDFRLNRNYSRNIFFKISIEEFDFLQVGFLKMGLKQRFDVLYFNLLDLGLKAAFQVGRLLPHKYKDFILRKLFVREQEGVHKGLVLNDIRPGAHCYIVSRRFAQAMLEINRPPFLSVDNLYMSLGPLKTFRMARFRRSLVGQSDRMSSVVNRFKLTE